MKQFGSNFLNSDFVFKAKKISYIAHHVAIKNKILRLSHMNVLSDKRVETFMPDMSNRTHSGANIIDAAFCL